MKKYPSWEDISVPSQLVNCIKTIQPCYLLDSLVHQLVYRSKRKPVYNYTCNACNFQWTPERSEEVHSCVECGCLRITCHTQTRFSKQPKAYSQRTIRMPDDFLLRMKKNYTYYFNEEPPKDFVKVGWETYNVYAKFDGGELIGDQYPSTCLLRAALLCPYLWDNSFDWNEETKTDTLNTEHMSSIINTYCNQLAGKQQ